jgi:hypothetical protein
MNDFNERERAFEKKYERDEDLKFRIASRGARLFGQWAVEQLGLSGAEADGYVQQIIELGIKKTSRAERIAKVENDLKAEDIIISTHVLEKEMEAFYLKAREELAGNKAG